MYDIFAYCTVYARTDSHLTAYMLAESVACAADTRVQL